MLKHGQATNPASTLGEENHMTREAFETYIDKLTAKAAERPKAYTRWCTLLVALGYSYLGLVFLFSFASLIAVIALVIFKPNYATLKIALVLGAVAGGLAWSIFRGIWVRLSPPVGIEIKRDQAPELFEVIAEIQSALDSQPFHKVLLVNEFNASVVQIPRLGILGWNRNYLMIGIPLMFGLSPEEFKSVLAHEFGHLSKNHSSFSAWIYRVRASWYRVIAFLEKGDSGGGWALNPFLNWYWPKFSAASFVLARQNEYEADRCAVEMTSAEDAARALIRVHLLGPLLQEEFWPNIYKSANQSASPPEDLLAQQRDLLLAPLPPKAGKWMEEAFKRLTDNSDTHPCLKDRLAAFDQLPPKLETGDIPHPPAPPGATAFDAFLSQSGNALAEQMSKDWHHNMLEPWKQRHEAMSKLQQELDGLDVEDESSRSETLWKILKIKVELNGLNAALMELDELLEMDPTHPQATLLKAQHLLSEGDPAGLQLAESAIELDDALTQPTLEMMYHFHCSRGEKEAMGRVADRLEAFDTIREKAGAERSHTSRDDTFLPHGLGESELRECLHVLKHKSVAEVLLARKEVQFLPKSPCFIVGLWIKYGLMTTRETVREKVFDHVFENLELPGNYLVIINEEGNKPIYKAVKKALPEAVIWSDSRK